MYSRAAQRLRIFESCTYSSTELGFFAWQRSEAALACRPISRWSVEQHLGQAVLTQPRGQVLGRILVGEQVLHRLEPILGGGCEAIWERILPIHHGKVCG